MTSKKEKKINTSPRKEIPRVVFDFCDALNVMNENIEKELENVPEQNRKQIRNTKTIKTLREFTKENFLKGEVLAFPDQEALLGNLKRKIAPFFHTTPDKVYIVGSAKIGFSYPRFLRNEEDIEFSYENKPGRKKSDIDIAIIDEERFRWYEEKIRNVCRLHDAKKISPELEESVAIDVNFARKYAFAGWIRPDIMGDMEERKDWDKFFDSISYKKFDEHLNFKIRGGLFRGDEDLMHYILQKGEISLYQFYKGIREGGLPKILYTLPKEKVLKKEDTKASKKQMVLFEALTFLSYPLPTESNTEKWERIRNAIKIQPDKQVAMVNALEQQGVLKKVGSLYFFDDAERGQEKVNFVFTNDLLPFDILNQFIK